MKINSKVGFFAGLLLAASLPVFAATFQFFSPASGILKGNPSTYVTTAATSADVIALWTGTCNNTTFLRGDGACNLINLGANVTGTLPVGNGGTGAITLTGVLHGNGTSPFTASNVVLTSEVTGILPVANGGTNLSAAADDNVMVGNGTTWQSKLVATCLDTGGNHLNYDNTTNSWLCGTSGPGGITGFANPTASLGLTAINGAATTAMRSDAAPALSQGIAPTWTATHIFNNSNSQIVIQNTSAAADQKNTLIRVNTTGPFAISSSTDAAPGTAVKDLFTGVKTGTAWTSVNLGNSTDNPAFTVNGITLTPLTGSFVASFDDACTTTPTVTFTYQKVGTVVTMTATATSGFNCTGDSTNFNTTGTPVPTGLRPTGSTAIGPELGSASCLNNGTGADCLIAITTTGNVSIQIANGAAWTAAGNRFFATQRSITYLTNN